MKAPGKFHQNFVCRTSFHRQRSLGPPALGRTNVFRSSRGLPHLCAARSALVLMVLQTLPASRPIKSECTKNYIKILQFSRASQPRRPSAPESSNKRCHYSPKGAGTLQRRRRHSHHNIGTTQNKAGVKPQGNPIRTSSSEEQVSAGRGLLDLRLSVERKFVVHHAGSSHTVFPQRKVPLQNRENKRGQKSQRHTYTLL